MMPHRIQSASSIAPLLESDAQQVSCTSQEGQGAVALVQLKQSLQFCALESCDLYSMRDSLNDLLELTAEACQTAIAIVSMLEAPQQWQSWVVNSKAHTQSRLLLDLPFHPYTVQAAGVLTIEDVLSDDRFVNCPAIGQDFGQDFPIRFYAGVPLVSPEGCVLGVLAVLDNRPRRFNRKQTQALRTLGRQVAAQLSLRQSRAKVQQLSEQLDETQFHQQQQNILFQLASQIRNSLDLNTILQTTVDQIHQLLHVDRCQFLWCLPTESQFSFAVTHEAKTAALPSLLMELLPEQAMFLAETVPALHILKVSDVANASELTARTREFLMRSGIVSQLLLPLKTQSGQVGAIICSHYSARVWLDSEVKVLQAVTDQLAIALEQAELFSQVRANALTAQTQTQYLTEALQTLQHTQSQLIQHEKMSSLGQLVAGVAHEINNPVNFISGNIVHVNHYVEDILKLLDTYRACYPDPESAVQTQAAEIDLEFLRQDLPKLLASMTMGTDRIRQIVLSLRNFSRLDEAEIKPVDIHEGMDNTLLILQSRLKSTSAGYSISVVKEYDHLPLVECYAGQLNQVFMNVLANAIDAVDQVRDPVITITTKTQDCLLPKEAESARNLPTACIPSIVISIRDNGCGMSETTQQKLFNPFFTTKPIGKGTGLGLSISYQIIEKHRGVLRCISEVDRGTEFQIQIPIRAALVVK